mgnify:CR=1 FL=1
MKELGIISAEDGKPVYIGVDASGVYGASGRPTISIASNKVYTGGLFIGDFAVRFTLPAASYLIR